MKHPRDDRSPLAVGLEWSSRITTVALEMVLPSLLGYWLDQRWGTRLLFLILGTGMGFALGFVSLLRMTRPPKSDDHDRQH